MIAIVNWGNKHIIGGGEAAANAIYGMLLEQGLQVSLFFVSNKKGGPLSDTEIPVNVPFFYWSSTLSAHWYITLMRRMLKWGSIFLFETLVFAKTINGKYNTFILAESFLLAYLISRFTKKQVILRLHGPVRSRIFRFLVLPSVLIVANGYSYELSKRYFPLNVVLNIDPPLPKYYRVLFDQKNDDRSGGYTIAYVGRLEHIKGYDLIPEYVGTLQNFVPVDKLFIIGGGSGSSNIDDIFTRVSGVKCSYLGIMERYQVAQLLARSVDILIIPSRFDNSPNVLREALALGLKIIVSDDVFLKEEYFNNPSVFSFSSLLSIRLDDFKKRVSAVCRPSNEVNTWLNVIEGSDH